MAQLPVVSAQAVEIDQKVVAFLDAYCVRCHGPAKQNASLRFDTMPVALEDEAAAQNWQDILDVLNLDQMPPEDEKQPGDDELSLVLETLTNNLRQARERLNAAGGKVVLRRLNRREYRNTIRALFGQDVSIDSVPDDATVDGFDTIATAHTFSSLHLERYLSTGATVMDAFVGRGDRQRPAEVKRYEPEAVSRNVRENLEKNQARLPAPGSRPADRDGEIRRVDFQMLQSQLTTDYLAHPASKTGVLVPFRGLVPSVKSNESVFGRSGVYKVRVRCGVDSPHPVDGVFLELRRVPRQTTNVDHIDTFEVRGTIAKPQIIEFEAVVDGVVGNWMTIAR
ncbi:MAG: DUF1587 domain-containing protein [Pirellulaceae bacterium]